MLRSYYIQLISKAGQQLLHLVSLYTVRDLSETQLLLNPFVPMQVNSMRYFAIKIFLLDKF